MHELVLNDAGRAAWEQSVQIINANFLFNLVSQVSSEA